MSPTLLLVHGWGFEAAFWQPMLAHLPGIETVCWDLGFHGQPSQPPLPTGRPVVAVGHSLGLLWLLKEKPVTWDRLISINGFPRFTKAEDFPEGVAPRLLERMIARLSDAPEAVTADFLKRCGVDQPKTEGLAPAALHWGLKALADWDCRTDIQPDLALAGASDPIVSPAMSKACFAEAVLEWQDGGHLLPLTAPDWCAARLKSVLESLS